MTPLPRRRSSTRASAGLAALVGLVSAVTVRASTAPGEVAGLADVEGLVAAGRFAEAEAGARAVLTRVEASDGPDSAAAAGVLDVLVDALLRQGKAREAEPHELVQRAIAAKEKRFGTEHPEVAVSLSKLASLHEQRGDPASAIPIRERAVSILERARGPDDPLVAAGLYNLANTRRDAGDFAGARPLNERALAIWTEALGPEHPTVLTGETNLAVVLWAQGEYAAARPLLEHALAGREKLLGPDDPAVASSVNNLAVLLMDAGDYASARPLYERALAIRERVLGPDHPELATSLNNLGILLSRLGDDSAARPYYERAIAIQEKSLGPDAPDLAASASNLGLSLVNMADYAGAKRQYARALAMQEKALGPDHADLAAPLSNFASLLLELGDSGSAAAAFQRALDIREKALGPDHPDVATSLANLAVALDERVESARVRLLHERALAIREKALGPDHPDVATSLTNLAAVSKAAGEMGLARSRHERALRIQEEALGPSHPAVATTLGNLALLLAHEGDAEGARKLHERALLVGERSLGPDHPLVAWPLRNLARLELVEGNAARALDLALRADAVAREHVRLTCRVLGEREALGYAATRTSGLDVAISVAATARDPRAAARAWDAVVRSRALVLDEMSGRHRDVARSGDPRVARLAEQHAAAARRLATLVVSGPGDEPLDRHRELLDDARRARDRAEESLAAESAPFRDERLRQGLGLADVAAALPSGDALVAFVRYEHHAAEPSPSPANAQRLADAESVTSYAAFVLRADAAEPSTLPLGPSTAIDALVARWRSEAADPDGSEDECRTAGEELRRVVWDAIVSRAGNAKRVFVVPDGALHLVSVAALPARDGGSVGRYVIDDEATVHHLSAERDLVPSRVPPNAKGGLLALGGPAFDHGAPAAMAARPLQVAAMRSFRGETATCGDFASLRFAPLPGAASEVEDVARLWRDAPAGPQAVLTLSRGEATEAAFKAHAPGKRVLHVATHGFFLGGTCAASSTGARGLEAADGVHGASSLGAAENPLLLSGLALAGANRRHEASSDQEDGILTAEEIASLDLSGLEWAVLSACDTGLGDIAAGEGVLGLRRAFQVAGAGTVVMSLWAADDRGTRQWMRELHRARLERNLATAECVREASLSVLRDRREKGLSTHPFHWAGFVAAGDWR